MIKTGLKPNLPYAGILVVGAALLIVNAGKLSAGTLLNYTLILVFGYIAAIIDIRTKQIPNSLVLAMIAAWVISMTPQLFVSTGGTVTLLTDSLLGFLFGGGLFMLVYVVSRKGLGGGDVKYMASVGLYLGFSGAVTTMLCGTVLAALTGLVLILQRKIGRKDKIPLAPFLYIGILITVFLQ